jgi:hypothetical protein
MIKVSRRRRQQADARHGERIDRDCALDVFEAADAFSASVPLERMASSIAAAVTRAWRRILEGNRPRGVTRSVSP